MEELLCLNSGAQSFFDRGFAASKAVAEYTDLLTLVPLSSYVPATDEQTGKREACTRMNLGFIRGQAGWYILTPRRISGSIGG